MPRPFILASSAEREEVLALRAREGGMPIIYVNQVGGQDELVFDGGSCVFDANGEVRQRGPGLC
jgi:NAD+ synthase (glutamine-hydrolysing)